MWFLLITLICNDISGEMELLIYFNGSVLPLVLNEGYPPLKRE